jgi:ADP-heptose:LPS heptosyltransferase
LHTHSNRSGSKKIAVFRTDRFGDLILSPPVVEALKASRPGPQIDLVVNVSAGLKMRVHILKG